MWLAESFARSPHIPSLTHSHAATSSTQLLISAEASSSPSSVCKSNGENIVIGSRSARGRANGGAADCARINNTSKEDSDSSANAGKPSSAGNTAQSTTPAVSRTHSTPTPAGDSPAAAAAPGRRLVPSISVDGSATPPLSSSPLSCSPSRGMGAIAALAAEGSKVKRTGSGVGGWRPRVQRRTRPDSDSDSDSEPKYREERESGEAPARGGGSGQAGVARSKTFHVGRPSTQPQKPVTSSGSFRGLNFSGVLHTSRSISPVQTVKKPFVLY